MKNSGLLVCQGKGNERGHADTSLSATYAALIIYSKVIYRQFFYFYDVVYENIAFRQFFDFHFI